MAENRSRGLVLWISPPASSHPSPCSPPFLVVILAVIFARVQHGPPDCSGQPRTSTASSRLQWAAPDLNRGALERTGPRRTSPGDLPSGLGSAGPQLPEDMSDNMPERMAEDMSEEMSEDMSDNMSERMAEDMSEEMSEDMSIEMSDNMSDICQRECQKKCQKICQ